MYGAYQPSGYSNVYYNPYGYFQYYSPAQPSRFYWDGFYSGYDSSGKYPSGNPPGNLGIAPELLNEIFNTLRQVFGALRGNSDVLGQLCILQETLDALENLLEGLLVTQTYSCDGNIGVLPDLLNVLYDLLNSLLSSNAGKNSNVSLSNSGILPNILNSLSELLGRLLSSNPGVSSGSNNGIIPDLLDALDNFLRELLTSRRSQCAGVPRNQSICYNRFRGYYYFCYSRPIKSGDPGSPGGVGVVPELLNAIYNLLHDLLTTLLGNGGLLNVLGVDAVLLESLDSLLEQLLVSSSLPCSNVNDQGLIPGLLNALTDLLTRLLASNSGVPGGDGLVLGGILPQLLNSEVELLQRLLGSGAAAGEGGSGAVPKLLNALEILLKQLLSSRRAECACENALQPPAKGWNYRHGSYGQPGGTGILPNVVDILLELIRELLIAQEKGGVSDIELGVVPALLDALLDFLTDLLGSQTSSADNGVVQIALGDISRLLENLLYNRKRPGGSRGTIQDLLEAIYKLLNRLLTVGPDGQQRIIPKALVSVDALLKKLLL